MNAKRLAPPVLVIGWREWAALPDMGVPRIKVKVDTGARSSAIHVSELRFYWRAGKRFAHFKVHPLQRDAKTTVETHAEVLEERYVRDSGGKQHRRPVVRTVIELMGERWPIEVTLASRDLMGFRMLLGRSALRSRFLVNPGRSFVSGRPKKKKRKKHKKALRGSSVRSHGDEAA